MRKNKLIPLLSASLVMVMTFSGCSGSNSETTQASKPAPDFKPLTDIVDGRKNVYLIIKNLDSTYWQVIVDGAQQGGKDFDCNVYYSGTYAETDWEIQSHLIDEAVEDKADAILIAPDDSVSLSPKISEVYNKGVTVVLVDTIANTDNYDVCYMTDNLMAGQNAAQEMLESLRRKGTSESEHVEIAIQVGSVSSQTINERLSGFCQYWTNNAPEDWIIIDDVKCNEGDVVKAEKCAQELFDAYSGISGVFGTNNGSTVGFAKVIKERELTDVSIVGFDYSDEIAELISDDNYHASTMLQRQYDMGYYGVSSAIDIINGKEVEIKFVDTGVVVVNEMTVNDSEIQKITAQN